MNLILDIGNTTTKLAVYDGGRKVSEARINELTCQELEHALKGLNIKQAILSSVKRLPPVIEDLFFANIPHVITLSSKTSLPFKIEYKTPETLGPDRIAAVAGAFSLFRNKNVLIIDAGSAITYDFLVADIYKGGNISPGLNMRFKALNKFTDKLPLVALSENYKSPGNCTSDAINAGVISGIIYEINEYIRAFRENHTDFEIILTGGDGEYLKDKIAYEVYYDPDLVIDGLNYILEYNE